MFLLQTNINPKKKIKSGLKQVYGLNNFYIDKLSKEIGLNLTLPFKHLKKSKIGLITKWVNEQNIILKEDLKKKVLDNKTQLMSIKSYRGFRHKEGLPTRGQRTHTNGRTQRKLAIKSKKKKSVTPKKKK